MLFSGELIKGRGSQIWVSIKLSLNNALFMRGRNGQEFKSKAACVRKFKLCSLEIRAKIYVQGVFLFYWNDLEIPE